MEVKIEVEGKEKEDKEPEEYEICNWYDTLVRAEEIKADKEKMAYVAKHAAKQKAAVAKVIAAMPKGSVTEVKDLKSLKKRAQEEATAED